MISEEIYITIMQTLMIFAGLGIVISIIVIVRTPAPKKKPKIKIQSRDLWIQVEPDTEKMMGDLEEKIKDTLFAIVKRIVEHGDIDWSVLSEDGLHELFNIEVSVRRQKWDYHLLLTSDVEYKDT